MSPKFLTLSRVCLILLILGGCKSWHTLEFETRAQPIQFGPHLTTAQLDTLGIISGFYKQHYEEEVYSESEHVGFGFEGEDYVEESLSTSVYKALNDHPDHFIADGLIKVEVKRGITIWGVLKNFLASAITGAESEGGTYSSEIIQFEGVVYIKSGDQK